MKHNAKKILAMLLSFVLVLSLVPAVAAVSITDRDIFDLQDKMRDLLYEKYEAGDKAAVRELDNAFMDLADAYYLADENVTDEVVAAYNNALAVYLKYTAVNVTGVQLDRTELSLTVGGDTATLTATVLPDNATDKTVTWTTSDSNVATVANGVVTAQGVGTATITATATNGTTNTSDDIAATCTVKVNAAGFTVTYQPGDRASLKDGIQPPDGYKVDGQNIVKTGVKGEYKIEGLESCFNAPEGEVFDCWKDANGAEYRAPQKVNVTADLTLTAQWKEEKKPDGGGKKTSGGGSGFDLVFNIPGADNSWEYVGGYAPQQAYRVSLAPMQGGSAALGLTTGDSGTALNVYPTSAVYVFPNADPGYTLDKIVWSLIDGSASYDITEAKNFVMPAMDVVVYVTFRPVG